MSNTAAAAQIEVDEGIVSYSSERSRDRADMDAGGQQRLLRERVRPAANYGEGGGDADIMTSGSSTDSLSLRLNEYMMEVRNLRVRKTAGSS